MSENKDALHGLCWPLETELADKGQSRSGVPTAAPGGALCYL